MQKIVLKIIELFITFILGPLLIFIPQYDTLIGNTAAPIDFAVGNLSSAFVKASLFLLGLILSGFLIPFRSYLELNKMAHAKRYFRQKVAHSLKKAYDTDISIGFGQVMLDLNIRLALPHKILSDYFNFGGKASHFKLYDLEGFHHRALHPDLKLFKVLPPNQAQGIIGNTVVRSETLILDKSTPPQEVQALSKNLTAFQKAHTNHFNFICTIPVFSPKSKLVAVIVIDSKLDFSTKSKLPHEYFLGIAYNIYKDFIKLKKLLP